MNNQFNNQNSYSNTSDCGSPAKYSGGSDVNNNANSNAQSDIGFDANYGFRSAEGTAGKKYMCKNCGTMHYGSEAPKNCCKCDGCNFREM